MIEPSDLLGPNLTVRNSKGEVIFALKRKDKYPPTYYIFEKHEDRMDEDDKRKLDEAWSMLSGMAGRSGFPLYDTKEINDGIEAQMTAVSETDEFKEAKEAMKKTDDLVFVKDISFKLFDHGTGSINTLTVGVSLKDVSRGNGPEATS